MYDILERPTNIGDYVLVGRGGCENLKVGKVIDIKNNKLVVFVGMYQRFRYVENNYFYLLDKNDESLKEVYNYLEDKYKFQNNAINLCKENPDIAFRRLGGVYSEGVVDGDIYVYLGNYRLKVYEKMDLNINWNEPNCSYKLISDEIGFLYQNLTNDYFQSNLYKLIYYKRIPVIMESLYEYLNFEDLTRNYAKIYSFSDRGRFNCSRVDAFYDTRFLTTKPYLSFKMCVGKISDDLIEQTQHFESIFDNYKLVFDRIN